MSLLPGSQKLLLLLVSILFPLVASWNVETRRSTLLPWVHTSAPILGWAEERRDSDSHQVTVGWGSDETVTVKLPSIKHVESLASSLWPAGLAGAILCQSPAFPKNSSILEVGAGLGLAGQVLFQSTKASRCQLTDKDEEIMELLQESLVVEEPPNLSARCLEWRDEHDEADRHSMDIVLGTDVAYYFFLLRPLMDTVRHFLKPTNSLLAVISQANRQSQWDLYDNLVKGSYNQLTDQHEEAWPGKTDMLLYRLEMQEWQNEDYKAPRIDGTVPIALLLHQTPEMEVGPLTAHDCVSTVEDREHISMTF